MTRSALIGSLVLLSAGGSSAAPVAAPAEVKHLIWGTEEPYYSADVLPFLLTRR